MRLKRQFTIKTITVMTAFIALGAGWGFDRYRLIRDFSRELKRLEEERIYLLYDLEMEKAYRDGRVAGSDDV